MNAIQKISLKIESDRLKLQMGLDPGIDVDTLTLRDMWRRLCLENKAVEEQHSLRVLRPGSHSR